MARRAGTVRETNNQLPEAHIVRLFSSNKRPNGIPDTGAADKEQKYESVKISQVDSQTLGLCSPVKL